RAEGELGYAFSDGRISFLPTSVPGASGLEGRNTAHVYTATGRIVFRPRRQNFFGLVGGGIVGHGGDFYSSTTSGKTKGAGVAGLGLHSYVTPQFGVDITAEVFLYSTSIVSVNFPTGQSKFQQDVVVTIGIPIPAR